MSLLLIRPQSYEENNKRQRYRQKNCSHASRTGTINKFINYSLFSPTGDGAKVVQFLESTKDFKKKMKKILFFPLFLECRRTKLSTNVQIFPDIQNTIPRQRNKIEPAFKGVSGLLSASFLHQFAIAGALGFFQTQALGFVRLIL